MPIVLLDTSIDVRQGVSSCQLSYQTLLQMSDRGFHCASCLTRHFYRLQTGSYIMPIVLLDTSTDVRQEVTSCQLSYQTGYIMPIVLLDRLHHANCLTRQVTSCQLSYQTGYIMLIVLLDSKPSWTSLRGTPAPVQVSKQFLLQMAVFAFHFDTFQLVLKTNLIKGKVP